jgi:hypothetical protein
MPVVQIKRDWGDKPCIVRMICTSPDTLETVSATGYITAQKANIQAANNGDFYFDPTDSVLVNIGATQNVEDENYYGGTNYFFQISPDKTSLINGSMASDTQVALTALAGGGQTGATQLNPGFNNVTVVATAGDSVLLPANVLGNTVTVTNASTNSLNVFPATGDTINALSANADLAVAAGATTVFTGMTATNWRSK